jgi:hypothetical protein
VLGEAEAIVVEVRPFDLHGVVYRDVTIRFPDGSTETARLGPEAVPEDLRAEERVLATLVANMIISLRRP